MLRKLYLNFLRNPKFVSQCLSYTQNKKLHFVLNCCIQIANIVKNFAKMNLLFTIARLLTFFSDINALSDKVKDDLNN